MAAQKSNKPGAVKYFNDLKAKGYKDAANAMSAFKKNMPKAQLGEETDNMLVNKPGSGAKKSYGDDEYSQLKKQGFSDKDTFNIMKAKKNQSGMSLEEMGYRGLGPAKKGGAIKTKKKK